MISIHQGNILDAKTDYIVNSANGHLRHGGGLAKVIADAATKPWEPGPMWQWTTDLAGSPIANMRAARYAHIERVKLWHADHSEAPLIATGNAHMTSAGVLPFEGVIHAVGPIWNGGRFLEEDLLRMAYMSAMLAAPAHTSIAMPAISSGIFGMPIEIVAAVARSTFGWNMGRNDVELWLFYDEHYHVFKEEFDG